MTEQSRKICSNCDSTTCATCKICGGTGLVTVEKGK